METGFVRSETLHNGTFDVLSRQPNPRLRAFVHDYQGYIDHTPDEFSRRELPGGHVVFIISFGPPYVVSNAHSRDAVVCSSFIAGLQDTYVTNTQGGPTVGVQIDLTPVGAFLFLGRPMDELANRTVSLGDLFGDERASLTPRLAEAPDWDARFAMLDAMILASIAAARPASRGVVWAWRKLEETRGCASIGSLADDLGWSRKHLVAKFREQIGLTPKTAARIRRFNSALTLIERGAELPWTEIAYRSGYYDQAHFIRDFSEFTGVTPSEFVASRVSSGRRPQVTSVQYQDGGST